MEIGYRWIGRRRRSNGAARLSNLDRQSLSVAVLDNADEAFWPGSAAVD
jgi:hypothetical protein